MDIDFGRVFITYSVLLFSLTVHEAAHAWSADRLGDATARMMGRVSLNPAVHVDPIGTILFPLIALFTGVPVLGWAKPVPVSIQNLHGNWRRKFMIIAAAGPGSNLVLAVIAAILVRTLPVEFLANTAPAMAAPLFELLEAVVWLNVLLAVFNMVPVPPLDGGNVLSGLLTGAASAHYDRIRPYGFMILYGLMFSGILGRLVTPPTRLILSVLL